MEGLETLCHTKWGCKYHVGCIPKSRRKVLYKEWRRQLEDVVRSLAQQKKRQIPECHVLPDHGH